MTDFKVVIGANYGDEGKGLASRYFTLKAKEKDSKVLTVLFNGSCQRGHTVDLPNGKRHVFHHFGCGTMDGADTYFDQNFIINPTMFIEELSELSDYHPKVYCHPHCRVATPYDVILNRIVEEHRGNNKHGSCGLGVWETQVRYCCSRFNLFVTDMLLFNNAGLKDYLLQIKNYFFFERLKEYGINYDDIDEYYKELIKSEELLDIWITTFRTMFKYVTLANLEKDVLVDYFKNTNSNKYGTVIYEGAQGLALDEKNYRGFPHVSASSTTAEVPLQRIVQYRDDDDTIEVAYITRSYFTRHGAGYLTNECPMNEINPLIVDKTNTPNPYQDSIRYGKFDLKSFEERVWRDICNSTKVCHYHENNVTFSVFATHINYVSFEDPFIRFGEMFNKYYESADPYAENVVSQTF